jgi:beta-lactamase regulating signal transducer with metallopeptidase domain
MNGIIAVVEACYQISEYLLQQAVIAGGYAGLVALVVLAINLMGRRWITAGQMALLWGLVLVRLLLPAAPGSALSLQQLAGLGPAEPTPGKYLLVSVDTPDAAAVGAGTPAHAAAVANDGQWVEALIESLPLAWLVVSAASLAWVLTRHWQFCRRVRRWPACRDERLAALWEECCRTAGVRRVAPIVLVDELHQPAVQGALRAKLLLPGDAPAWSDETLRLVMLHELAHLRGRDLALNWLRLAIQSLHWWNPIYWLAASRYGSLREQACDAFVLRHSRHAAQSYRELLLTFAARQPVAGWRVTLPASILGFHFRWTQRRVWNRLNALRTARDGQTRWHAIAVLLLVALVAYCGLTDAKPPQSAEDWLPKATVDRGAWTIARPIADGPTVVVTYETGDLLALLAESLGVPLDAARKALKTNVEGILNAGRDPRVGGAAAPQVSIDESRLIVSARQTEHDELRRLLAAWRAGGFSQISIETRFLSGLPDLASWGVSWQYVKSDGDDAPADELAPGDGTQGPVVRAATAVDDYFLVGLATLDKAQARRLVDAAQSNRRANVLQAPKITLFNGQQASIFDVTQRPFVIGMLVEGGKRQPKIDVVDEGVKLALRATVAEASRIRLSAQIALADIGEVRTIPTSLGSGAEAIQIPRVHRCRIEVTSQTEPGQSLLVGCVPSYDAQRIFYVLLTPRLIVP